MSDKCPKCGSRKHDPGMHEGAFICGTLYNIWLKKWEHTEACAQLTAALKRVEEGEKLIEEFLRLGGPEQLTRMRAFLQRKEGA